MAKRSSDTRIVHGIAVPAFFYGTAWKEERTRELTAHALQEGFRAIDTANQRRHYVEAAVGEAIAACLADGSLTRAELFLQTKFTHARGQDHRLPYDPAAAPATQVAQSFQSSLAHLGTSYLDSYLLHGPSLPDRLSDADWQAWRAIAALRSDGKARLIGVSNVAPAHLAPLCRDDDLRPAFVQNRCYARTGWDREVRALCRAHDIVYQGFSLLTANQRELGSPTVRRIASRAGRTPAQVVFRFALQIGILPLTGTADRRHMREDLDCGDFEIGDDEVNAIASVSG
jgi:diketogulonate reductase-like aldo/keto reductase